MRTSPSAVILLSAYYGSFDLLPVSLGFNGVRAAACTCRTKQGLRYTCADAMAERGAGTELVPGDPRCIRLPRCFTGGTIAAELRTTTRRSVASRLLSLACRRPRCVRSGCSRAL